jgi:hypothetical protein
VSDDRQAFPGLAPRSAPVPAHNVPGRGLIPPRTRDLMLRACDGDRELGGVMHILGAYNHRDRILLWLISHRYTGKALRDLLIIRFRGSVHALVQFVVMQVNRGAARVDLSRSAGAPEAASGGV